MFSRLHNAQWLILIASILLVLSVLVMGGAETSAASCNVATFDPAGFTRYFGSANDVQPVSGRPNAHRLGTGLVGFDQSFTASVDGGTEYIFSGEYKTSGTPDYNVKLYIGDDSNTQFSFNIPPTASWQPFEVRVTAPNVSSAVFRTEIWKGDGGGYLDIGNMSVTKAGCTGQSPTATPQPQPTATSISPTATPINTGPTSATLNGIVYQDTNGNGVRDGGESMSSAALVLFQDSACDGAWVGDDQWVSTIEVTGNYSFDDLQSGDCYFIQAFKDNAFQYQTESITLISGRNINDIPVAGGSTSIPTATPRPPQPTPTQPPTSGSGNVLRVVMDRSASIFNRLYFTDVTLKIDVGGNNVTVRDTNGRAISHAVHPNDSRYILVTTDKNSIDIVFSDNVNTTGLGTVTVTTLKDDKAWAWSHGLDDNMGWREAINVLTDEHGYTGMLYFITDIIEDNREENWITDKPYAIQYLNNGWSIGNHTADHSCDPSSTGAAKTNIQNGFNRLTDIVNDSAVPDYKITAFAAPCLVSQYHPAVLQLRDSQTTHILFNEGKSPVTSESDLMRVDSNTSTNVSANGKTALAINVDSAIGRYSLEGDLNTSYGQSQLANAKAKLDWMSQNKSDSQHFWFNTLAHGGQQVMLGAFVDYLDQNYKTEAWVAPSDQIYSYMLVRDNISVSANFTGGGGGGPIATPTQPPSGNISIEIANQSGVPGYSFAVFGAGFGNSQGSGSVKINGTSASITSWRDGLVEGIVPATSVGATTLRITNAGGDAAENSFQVYEINPIFLQPLTQTYQNVIFGKEAVVVGATDSFCYDQISSSQPTIQPSTFLTDFTCGNSGYSKEGRVDFSASSNSPAIIAVDAGQSLSGEYVFQFMSEANWYKDGGSYPERYEIQVSSNSTNGVNGSWQTMHNETANSRSQRMHGINVPAGKNWIRIKVTQGDFALKEIRLYEASSANNTRPDSYAIYGDSLTADAFNMIGRPTGTANDVKTARGTSNDIVLTTLGLSGQNSSGFLNDNSSENQIHDAFSLDNMDETVRFWGLAIGSNDASQGSDLLEYDWTNISQYDERLEQVVQHIINDGNVPIIARIPDIIPSEFYGADLEAKRKILRDTDRISAEYGLIPGPDFYSTFRENIEFDGNTFIGGDGIHHTREGQRELVRGWANTFARIP